jgi:hypothetical protein
MLRTFGYGMMTLTEQTDLARGRAAERYNLAKKND